MNILDVNQLHIQLKASGKPLVQGVGFSIAKGETLALVGESGSGKSLTALAIMRLLAGNFNTNGDIIFHGEHLQQVPDKRMQAIRGHDISMVFQEPMTALNPLHTIGRQIAEAFSANKERSSGQVPQNAAERVQELLDQVGLSHFKDRLDAYPHQLSGGERQRVMIAMAIANKPALLIADEPTTAVDVHVQQHILELLAKLKRDMGMSMLFITHDLPLVKRMADKVAVMRHGEIVEIGSIREVFENPKHPYTKTLLDSAPKGRPLPVKQHAEAVITAEDISVHFPIKRGIFARTIGRNTAVEHVNLTLMQGETLGIVGESGSGKTTLAFALLQMQAYEGMVVFAGKPLTGVHGKALKALRKDMQLVFQDPYSSLNPRMTVGEIIGEGLKVHQPRTDAAPHIAAILEKVGLSADMASRYPHEFSGGQRQRISIARAMILQPKLVILDEPTSALDLTVQSQILDLLKKFQAEQGISFIFISHDLRAIRAISHHMLVLQKGKVVEAGHAEDIFQAPKAAYTKQLIDAAML